MTSPTISVGGLTRRYRGQLALDNVTFDVQGASITGLLGRNGAGKTTLLRIVAGHEFASAGSVTVLGASPVKDEEVLRRMVFIREDQTYPDIKVRQTEHPRTVLLSTHLIDEAAGLLERVVVIDRGRVVRDGAPGDLWGGETLTLQQLVVHAAADTRERVNA
jgi:ABC-type multidrug transport system ATPase subunit